MLAIKKIAWYLFLNLCIILLLAAPSSPKKNAEINARMLKRQNEGADPCRLDDAAKRPAYCKAFIYNSD